MKHYLASICRLLRPQQWLKNLFILIGIIYSHAWHDQQLVTQVVGTIIAFSFLSSSIYILNDIFDRKQDRLHPVKQYRPLAAGIISLQHAIIWAISLGGFGLGFGFYLSQPIGWILLCYTLLNFCYDLLFKHVVILDVFCIAAGFMLRILAGTIGVGIMPSQWLMLCGLMITLFLGFVKRRAELLMVQSDVNAYRKVLEQYNTLLLDSMINITAGGTIITYSLYTMSAETIKVHHTANLIYTVPCVMYGIFRYMYLLHGQPRYDLSDVAQVLLRDRHLLIIVSIWIVLTFYLIT